MGTSVLFTLRAMKVIIIIGTGTFFILYFESYGSDDECIGVYL